MYKSIKRKIIVKETIFILFITFSCLAMNFAFAAGTDDEKIITYEFEFSIGDLSFGKIKGYDTVNLPDCIFMRDAGKPRLPVKVLHFAVEKDAHVDRVEIVFDTKEALSGEYNIYPAQKSVKISDIYEFTPPDPSVYNSSESYPGKRVEVKAQGSLSGTDIVTIHVYPLEYIPLYKKLIFHRKMSLKIVQKIKPLAGQAVAAEAAAARSVKGQNAIMNMLNKVVSNPGDIKEPLKELSQAQLAGMAEVSGTVDYLIITSQALKDSGVFQPLIDSKVGRGLTVLIEAVETIENDILGRDTEEKIRNYIKDKHTHEGLVWCLLGGDTNIIPSRIATTDRGTVLCDMYYSDLDGDWDADGDDKFGEVDDNIDMYPDVFVGRAPVEDETEAQTFVNKVLTYEANAGSYYNKVLFLGCEDFGDAGGTTKDLIDTDYMPEIFDPITKHYERDLGSYCQRTITAMNEGYALINHIDHANTDLLCTGSDYLSISDIDGLTNVDAPSIIWSCGCFPASIDTDCIAEHWITNPNGGGVAFVGNSRYGWHPESDQMLDPEFYKSLFVDMLFNIGQTLADSKITFIGEANTNATMRYAMFELNLLGDPELRIRFDISDGIVMFNKEIYAPSSQPDITVVDTDLNVNTDIQDVVEVYVTSLTETTPEPVLLTETGPDTSIFKGNIQLEPGTPSSDGIIQVSVTDEITVMYYEDSPSGTETDTAAVDGIVPVIAGGPAAAPFIEFYGYTGVTISWQTDEPTTSTVYYGTTALLGTEVTVSEYVTEHIVTIKGLNTNTLYHFAVESVDMAGNTVYNDNGGDLYQFTIIPPNIEIVPDSLTLESLQGASPFNETITLSNTGAPGCCELLFLAWDSEQWLRLSPKEGGLERGASQNIQVKVDPTWLDPGTHQDDISIRNNKTLASPIVIPITLNVTAAPALYMREYHIVDDWSGRSYMGNGDRGLNPGERVDLKIKLENIGSLQVTSVSSTLSLAIEDPYVTILDDAANYPDIVAGDAVFGLDDFLIEVDENTPQGHTVTFELTIRDVDNHVWSRQFRVAIAESSSIANIGDIRLNTHEDRSQLWSSRISSDNSGNIYVVWHDPRNGEFNIYFNYSRDYGITWQINDIRLDTDASGSNDSKYPEISSDSNGNVYVVWADRRNGESDIYFNYSRDYGVTWQSNDIRLNTNDAGSSASRSAEICSDNNGNIYIVWKDSRNGEDDIYLNYSRDHGATWQANDIRLNADTAGSARSSQPWISSDNNGNIYVVWTDDRYDHDQVYPKTDIYFTCSLDYGVTWLMNDIRLNTDETGSAFSCDPRISSDNNGNIYVVWQDLRNEKEDIYFNYSHDYGATWQANDIRIDTGREGSRHSFFPEMTSDNNGNIYIVWMDCRNNDYDPDIYFNFSRDYGATWQMNDIRIDTNGDGDAMSSCPRISSDNNGNVYIVWMDNYYVEHCHATTQEIRFNYSCNYGGTWQSSDIRLDDTEAYDSIDPQISSDNNRNVYVVWQDSRIGIYNDVYFTSILIEPPTLNHIQDHVIDEGALCEFTVTASNLAGTPVELFWNAQELPQPMQDNLANATFETSFNGETGVTTGTFRWVPSLSSSGVYDPVIFIARNPSGRCAYQAMSITVNDAALYAPSDLNTTVASTSRIDLTWTDNSPDETGFRIERSEDGSTFTEIHDTEVPNITGYSDTVLEADTRYYYRVRAYNALGYSGYSNVHSSTTYPNPPEAPSDLIVSAISDQESDLSWTDNSDNEDGFTVEQSLNGTTFNEIYDTEAKDITGYRDLSLEPETTYYYRVRAYNMGGASPYSNTAQVTTMRCGSISGQVIDELEGMPIPDIFIVIRDWSSDNVVAQEPSLPDGNYVITDILSGDYRVCADPGDSNYGYKYYNNVEDWSNAAKVTVSAEQNTPDINIILPIMESIALDMYSEFNQIGFSVIPQNILSPFRTSELEAFFGAQDITVDKIMQWDGAAWISYCSGLPFTEFDLDLEQGIFVNIVSATQPAGTWNLEGKKIKLPKSINLSSGWNLVAIPTTITPATALGVLGQINLQGGTADVVIWWDGAVWVSTQAGLPFTDQVIVPGRSYFIRCAAGSTWDIE